MKYPEFLKAGGKIGFIAPSFGCVMQPYKSLFDAAQKRFREQGYHTVTGPNCYEDKGVGKSNTPEACGAEINDFFINDKSDVIISCGGGETMCEDLPHVDFEGIRAAKPKWYMGYSDNTNLTFTLPTICDIAAIYGPNVSSYGARKLHPSLMDAFCVLKGENLTVSNYEKWEISDGPAEGEPDIYAPYNCTEDYSMSTYIGSRRTYEEIRLQGRLLGGCMDSLVTLCGTKFDKVKAFNQRYKSDGTLWFMEACDFNPMAIRRALWQLRNAGWFDTATGFIFGRALHYDEDYMGVNRINAVTDVLGDMNLPIVIDADLGHLPPMMPVICGSIGKANAVSSDSERHFTMKMELK